MILNKPIHNGTPEWVREMNEIEREDDTAQAWKQASEESRRKDAARWSLRACDKTLAEFELLGFRGFRVTRDADGLLVFEGVGDVPNYLMEKTA